MEHPGHARLDFRLDGTARGDSGGLSAVQRGLTPLRSSDRPLRLLFAESSTRGYGTEQHIAALATAMARRGHDVRCLASAGSPVESLLREAGVSTISVRPGHSRGLRMALSLL